MNGLQFDESNFSPLFPISGKSSLLQFLLVLKQTVEATDTESPFSTRKREGLVDIGGYEDFIFKNERDNPLSFRLYFEGETNIETESVIRYNQDEIYLDTFTADLDGKSIKINSRGEVEQNFIDDHLLSEILEEFRGRRGEELLLFRKEKFYCVPNSSLYSRISFAGRSIRIKLRRKIEELEKGQIREPMAEYSPKEVEETSKSIMYLASLHYELSTTFQNLFYLGPLREHPQRYYFISGEKPIHVGTKGERAVEVLYITNRTSAHVFQKVNSWFKRLGFGEVSVKPLTESLYALNVTHPTIKKGASESGGQHCISWVWGLPDTSCRS